MQAAVTAIVIAATAALAGASPSRDLDRGTESFRAKDYEKTKQFVGPLLYPQEQLAQPEDLVLAHVLYGASLFETGRRDEARGEFEKALLLDPNKTLDTLVFSTGSVHLFDEVRDDIAARRKRDEALIELEKEREKLRIARENASYFESQPFVNNFVPFGYGQFRDHRRGWGAVFATSQGLSLATTLATWGYLVGKYGLPAAVGVKCFCVTVQDARNVNTIQGVEVVSGVAFIGAYVLGVIDAYRHYRPKVQVNMPPDLLKQLENPKPAPKKTSLVDRVHVVPMATQSGFGIGLGLEN